MPRSLARIFLLMAMLCGIARAADTSALWIDVPFVAQTGEGCGAASIAMIMQYWQQHLDKPQPMPRNMLTSSALSTRRKPTASMPRPCSATSRKTAIAAFAFTGDAATLQDHLAKGRPLIAALKPGAGSTLHYVVVVGIDPARQTVLVNDPAQRKLLTEDTARFEHEWAATGHWTLLAVPPIASEVTAR